MLSHLLLTLLLSPAHAQAPEVPEGAEPEVLAEPDVPAQDEDAPEEAVQEEAPLEEAAVSRRPTVRQPVDDLDDAGTRARSRGSQSAAVGFGAAYGAYAGGMGVWLVGEALEETEASHTFEGVPVGALLGAATGGVVSGVIAHARPGARPEASSLLYSGTTTGWYYGDQLGRMLIPVDAPGAIERVRATGLAGSMTGLGLGIAYGARARPVGQQLHFMAANGVGWIAGHGVGDMAGWDRVEARRLRALVETGTSLGFGGAATLANRAGLDAPQAGTLALALADGAWFGGRTPSLFSDAPAANQVVGGLQLGVGVGYGAALAMAIAGEPTPRSVGLQGLGLAAGSALGMGVPLSLGVEEPSRAVVGPMLAAGAAGQAFGALLAPRWEPNANDAALLAGLEGWTLYQSVGWSSFGRLYGATEAEVSGYALAAGGAGTLVAMGMAPALDVSFEGTTLLLSGGAWGTWFGAWGSQIAGADADGLWLASLAAGNGGLLGSAIAQGAGWHPTWRQAASINGGGLVGAAAGGLLGAIALYNPDDWTPVSASVVVGSGVGLAAGAVLGTRPGRADAQARRRTFGGGRLAALADRSPVRASAQLRPWAGEDGGRTGVWVQLDLTER